MPPLLVVGVRGSARVRGKYTVDIAHDTYRRVTITPIRLRLTRHAVTINIDV